MRRLQYLDLALSYFDYRNWFEIQLSLHGSGEKGEGSTGLKWGGDVAFWRLCRSFYCLVSLSFLMRCSYSFCWYFWYSRYLTGRYTISGTGTGGLGLRFESLSQIASESPLIPSIWISVYWVLTKHWIFTFTVKEFLSLCCFVS